jgi:MFS family permease
MVMGAGALRRDDAEWRAWISLGVLIVFYVLAYVDRAMLPLLVEPIQADLGLNDIQIGVLQGCAFSLIYGLTGLPMGWAADRFSRRNIIFGGAVFWSISATMCGLARNFGMLFLARSGVGAGESCLAPSAQSLIATIFPRRKLAFALAVYGQSASLGGGLALAIGGVSIAALTAQGGLTVPVVGHLQPWQAMFFICGLAGLPLSALIFLVREPRRVPASEGGEPPGTLREFVGILGRERRLVASHLIGFPACALMIYAISAWTPAFLSRKFGLEVAQIGLIIGVLNAGFGAAGNMGVGLLADWLVKRGVHDAYYRVQMAGILIGAPAVAAAFLMPHPALTIACLAVFECTLSAFGGISPAALNLMVPNNARAKLLAIYWLIMGLTGCAGPVIVATLTTFLFQDRTMVGGSVAILVAVISPIAFTALWIGRAPLARVVQARNEADRLATESSAGDSLDSPAAG